MIILIVGLGSIAAKHIKALQQLNIDAGIYALRSGENKSDIDGITNIYQLGELKEKPDFIILSNPTWLHTGSIRECIRLKVPLFIEKPLSNSMEGIPALISEINQNEIQTYVACNLRHLTSLNFVKNNLPASSKICEVNIYCGSYLPDWRPEQKYNESYSANTSLGGGVNLDLIHEIDYCCWLFGLPLSSKGSMRNTGHLEIDSADYGNFLLNYNFFSANVILNYYRPVPERTLEIVFSDNVWTIDLLENKVEQNGLVIFQDNSRIIDTYKLQMKYFIEGIESRNLMNPVNEAAEVLKIALNYDII